jgi:uncharacterized protein
MFELPLFPLDTVLFPGTAIRLHIFEERYKQMIGRCLEQHIPFGVVLIQHGLEAYGDLAEPYSVGTTAQIVDVQRLSQGQMNITAVGKERFKVLSFLTDDKPYLVGTVELFPLVISDPKPLVSAGQKLRQLVLSYLDTLADAGIGQYEINQIPEDPVSLSYAAASIIPLGNQQKQELLTVEDALSFVQSIDQVFRLEKPLLREFLSHKRDTQGIFSLN